MKTLIVALSLVAPLAAAATPASAQQDPEERARIEDLTRRLNGAPPAPQRAAPERAAPPTAQAAPQASPSRSTPAPAASPPAAARQDPAERARIDDLTRRLNGAPASPTPQPQSPRPTTQPQAAPRTPSAPPSAAPVRSPQPAPAPAPQGLSAAERAALPFRIDLPPGFQLVEGRAAPGAHVYSARKAGKTYLMIYAGPSSQFPIYDGDQVTVGGRVSVVTTEGQRRIAMEHLFQRSAELAEIHVWLMAQDGADRDEAERIAQTVDPK
ncbi:hypothetical protein ABE453_08270 [Brevundimonas diminuta]|uniref:hypothetical protein n=1 Tax=Brevundimonas diminuta TaxID=293 RepID=UPI003209A2C6